MILHIVRAVFLLTVLSLTVSVALHEIEIKKTQTSLLAKATSRPAAAAAQPHPRG